MKFGLLQSLLTLLLMAGSAWLGSHYLPMGARACGPVPLSPEARAYIDSHLPTAAAACGDIPKILSRVADLEGRIGDLDKFRQLREQIEEKRQQLEQAISQQRHEQEEALANSRAAELEKLRQDVKLMCAGVTLKRGGAEDQTPPAFGGARRRPGSAGQAPAGGTNGAN